MARLGLPRQALAGRRSGSFRAAPPGPTMIDVDLADLEEGARIGRFLVVRDVEGQRHAVAIGAVSALGETDQGVILLLPGGRLIHVPEPMERVLRWLGG